MSLIRERGAVVVCLLEMLFGGASLYYTNCLEGLCLSGDVFYELGGMEFMSNM